MAPFGFAFLSLGMRTEWQTIRPPVSRGSSGSSRSLHGYLSPRTRRISRDTRTPNTVGRSSPRFPRRRPVWGTKKFTRTSKQFKLVTLFGSFEPPPREFSSYSRVLLHRPSPRPVWFKRRFRRLLEKTLCQHNRTRTRSLSHSLTFTEFSLSRLRWHNHS